MSVDYIESLSRKHCEEIGFLPRPRLEQYVRAGQCAVATENDDPCGFLVWGSGWPVLRVYQVCVQYDARLRDHGASLVQQLIARAEASRCESVVASVASDLEANAFWGAMQFRIVGVRRGGRRRGRTLNVWRYACRNAAQGTLF